MSYGSTIFVYVVFLGLLASKTAAMPPREHGARMSRLRKVRAKSTQNAQKKGAQVKKKA